METKEWVTHKLYGGFSVQAMRKDKPRWTTIAALIKSEKDANLIAAAPEMYRVLFKIRAAVIGKQEMGKLDVTTAQELLAALDKAEGV